MQDIDKNGTGKVTKENFVQIMINKLVSSTTTCVAHTVDPHTALLTVVYVV